MLVWNSCVAWWKGSSNTGSSSCMYGMKILGSKFSAQNEVPISVEASD